MDLWDKAQILRTEALNDEAEARRKQREECSLDRKVDKTMEHRCWWRKMMIMMIMMNVITSPLQPRTKDIP